jgi:hypothetical protein
LLLLAYLPLGVVCLGCTTGTGNDTSQERDAEQSLALRGSPSALVDMSDFIMSTSIFLSFCPVHGGSGPFQHLALLDFALGIQFGIRACAVSGCVRGDIPSIFFFKFCL